MTKPTTTSQLECCSVRCCQGRVGPHATVASPPRSAEATHAEDKTYSAIGVKRASSSKPTGEHNVLRVRCKHRPMIRADGIPPPTSLGKLVTADHTTTGTLSPYKTDTRVGNSVILRKAKTHKKLHFVCEDFWLHFKNPEECSQTV